MIEKTEHIPKKKLTPVKLKVISYLLDGDDIATVAKKVKAGRSTVYSWMKDQQFRDLLQEGREALFYEGLGQLKGAMSKASKVLIGLLSSKEDNQRRLAARAIFDYGLRGFDLKEIEDRLTRIEEILEQRIS